MPRGTWGPGRKVKVSGERIAILDRGPGGVSLGKRLADTTEEHERAGRAEDKLGDSSPGRGSILS